MRQDASYRVHCHPQSVALGIQLVLPALNSPLHWERIECSTQSVVSILGEGLARRENNKLDSQLYRAENDAKLTSIHAKPNTFTPENDKKPLFTIHYLLFTNPTFTPGGVLCLA